MTSIKDIIFHIGPLNWAVHTSQATPSRTISTIIKLALPLFYLYESLAIHVTTLYQMYHIVSYKDSKYASNRPVFGYTNSLTKIICFIFGMSKPTLSYIPMSSNNFFPRHTNASLGDNLGKSFMYLIHALFSPFLDHRYQVIMGLIIPIIRNYMDLGDVLEKSDCIAARFFIDKSQTLQKRFEIALLDVLDINGLKNVLTNDELKHFLSVHIKYFMDHLRLDVIFKNIAILSEYLPSDFIDELFSPYYEQIQQKVTESIFELAYDNCNDQKIIDLIFSEKFFDKQAILNTKYNFKNTYNYNYKLFLVLDFFMEKLSGNELKSFYSINCDYLNHCARYYRINSKMYFNCVQLMRPILALKNLHTQDPKILYSNELIERQPKKRFQKDFHQFILSKFTKTEFKKTITSLFHDNCAYLNLDLFLDFQWIAKQIKKETTTDVINELIVACPDLEIEYNELIRKLFQTTFVEFKDYDMDIQYGPKIEIL